MAEVKVSEVPQYGKNQVKSPNCILLWSSLSSSSGNKLSQKSLESKLLSKRIRLEQIDGALSQNKELRNNLFSISRKRGKYPQIFIKDDKNQIKFIGMDTDINFLIDSENFDKVFKSCMNSRDSRSKPSTILDKEAEASRYKKLAEDWLGANNLFKAKKFAQKSLRLNDNQDVRALLSRIKEAQLSSVQSMDLLQTGDPNEEIDEKKSSANSNDAPKQNQDRPLTPHAGDHELLNQILEQNMAFQQRNKQLEEENRILKEQMKLLQGGDKEEKKEVEEGFKEDVIKGTVYECSIVEEHTAKQRSDIHIRSGVESSQNESNKKLKGHETTLTEWDKHTQYLNEQFLKFKGNDDQNENGDEKENKENDEDEEALNVSLDVSLLYLSYRDCMKLLQGQQQRTEDVMKYCIDLNEETKSLKSIIKIYNNDVPTTKHKYDELCQQYESLKQQREHLQDKVKNMVIEINKLIKEENETNHEKCVTLDKFNLLRMELDKYSSLLKESRELTNKYSLFEDGVEEKTSELKVYFDQKWDLHERNWSKWDINGIICWLKYLIHNDNLRLSKGFDLKVVEQKMSKEGITGLSLNEVGRGELKEWGFDTFPDRVQTYKMIRSLVEKYPGPIKDCIKKPSDPTQVSQDQEGKIIKIPQQYKCPISGKIMVNPVVAYDNKTYEKENIIAYIKKHGRAPDCEHESDGTEPLVRNKQLKIKIEQFLWANPSVKGE